MHTPSELTHVVHEYEDGAHWLFMHRQKHLRPCCHVDMLGDFRRLQMASETEDDARSLRHMVVGSLAPVFNLGGDLEHFVKLIGEQDREALMTYGRICVDGVYTLHHHFDSRTRAIALVQGDALGGGMELALACQSIVMERGARMGLPEIKFGLFPGMGAYSFLRQRVSPHLAERMILSGDIYDADTLLAMGVVDHVAEPGQGAQCVRDLIRREQRAPHAHLAMGHVRRSTTHISREELLDIVELWVDTALKLPPRSIKIMEHLVRAQYRMVEDREAKQANVVATPPRRPGP